ncbi:hypothetical protein Tco_1042159 [Tanacetum coccineum]|uniref:Uncharacterized protein n=1 Tax=Tanacetum coccineum TaxID=301880 RepID=A0ABQ5GJG1_9ASTR
MVTNVRTPALDNVDYRHTKLFESRGSLLLLMKDASCRYYVSEMREESSEWSMKYILDDLINIVPSGPSRATKSLDTIPATFASYNLKESRQGSFPALPRATGGDPRLFSFKLILPTEDKYPGRHFAREMSGENSLRFSLGEWSGPQYPTESFQGFLKGLYWNNAIHWINYHDKLHSKCDIVDHPMVTNIRTPALDNVDYTRTKLFESRGSLLLLMKKSSRRYHVFEMREESSEWSVKYILDDLINIVPSGGRCKAVFCVLF